MIPRLVCTVARGTLHAELRSGRRLRWAAQAEWTDSASLREAVASLAGRAELPGWGRSIRFLVTSDLVQRRELSDLPAVGRDRLGQLVTLATHRYFRRNGVPLVTNAAWTSDRRVRTAVAVAVELPLLEALVAGAGEAGLSIDSIDSTERVRGGPLSLLPPDEQLRRDTARRRWTRGLAAAAVVAWVCLGAALVVAQIAERRRIDARLAEIGPSVVAVLAAEAASDSLERMVGRLREEAGIEGEVVASLYRVALALPDSAFLTQLRVDSAGFGLVAGAARRPAAVLAALESRAGLTAPRFSGRTTSDQVAGRPVERFAIGFGAREVHP